MLATLEQRHRELTALMISMHELIANDEIDYDAVTRTRLALSRASAARSMFLANMVYPALLNALADPEASSVREVQAGASADRARSSAHVAKWSASGIARDWQGFRRDAAGILAMMEARIALERRTLYSLLRKVDG